MTHHTSSTTTTVVTTPTPGGLSDEAIQVSYFVKFRRYLLALNVYAKQHGFEIPEDKLIELNEKTITPEREYLGKLVEHYMDESKPFPPVPIEMEPIDDRLDRRDVRLLVNYYLDRSSKFYTPNNNSKILSDEAKKTAEKRNNMTANNHHTLSSTTQPLITTTTVVTTPTPHNINTPPKEYFTEKLDLIRVSYLVEFRMYLPAVNIYAKRHGFEFSEDKLTELHKSTITAEREYLGKLVEYYMDETKPFPPVPIEMEPIDRRVDRKDVEQLVNYYLDRSSKAITCCFL